jgi:Bacterial Ig domain
MRNKKMRIKTERGTSKGKRGTTVIICVLAGLALIFCFAGIVASWRASVRDKAPNAVIVPVSQQVSLPLAKEYIYAGSKFVATEEPNVPPTVSILSPANNAVFTAPANITIGATANDADGNISKVEFYQGTTLLGTDTTPPFSFTWTNVGAGSYSLTATATDNNNAVTTSGSITVVANAAPTVSITGPTNNATLTAPANISITASAIDSDGTISQVQFFQGSTLIGTATSAPYTVNWNNVAAGTYALTAQATDNRGATSTSSVVTVISNAAPAISITSPATNTIFAAPANIVITASASDADGTISQVQFYQGTTLIGTATSAPYTVSWSNVPAASYALTAKATDNRGAITSSAVVNVISNALPTVSISSPANNATFTAPANVSVTASAADVDGTISKVEFYQGTTLIGTGTTTPYTISWSNVAPGSYSVTAKATDNRNAVTTSAAVNVTVNPSCAPGTGVIISEFRLRGPNGSNDEYIELYNNSSQNITVCTTDGSSGWAVVSSDGSTRFVIASGTVIAARSNRLAVAAGYSLGAYNGSTVGDISYSPDVPDNTGVVIFNTANPSNFTLANRLDAVGFNTSNTLYREGAGLSPLGANSGEFCFLRKLNSGTPQDTGDNIADFTFVATNAGLYGGILAILGAPGPENLFSPRTVSLAVTLLDPAVAASVAPNRVRDTTAVGPNAAAGTLSIRRTITNNTTSNITTLRFRVTDITTLNSPGYVAGGSQSDMRVLSSSDFNATLSNSQQVLVRGTTLQTPPTQSMGGGLNSSVSAGVISLSQPLAPGQSINVQFLLGVQQSGSFRFFFNVEAVLQ